MFKLKTPLPILLISTALLFVACKKEDPIGPTPSLNQMSVGTSANDFLAGNNYDHLTVEIVAVTGYQLDNSTMNNFKSFLEERLNKPNGITLKTSSISNPGLAPYTVDDFKSIESQFRTEYNEGKELTLFIFIADDRYTDENVLGVAYRNTSFAVLGERIGDLTGGIGQPSKDLVLQTVLRHEMGHLLGLVNLGSPMQNNHQDISHGSHCDVQNCLMYYAVETGDFLSNLVGSNTPPALDGQCIADLRANGGK